MEYDLAILISDLTGYTAMTEVHGGVSASGIVDRYVELVNDSLVGKSYLAERIGDQVVICSSDVDDLAFTAIQLNSLAAKENLFLPIHAGIHYGKIFEKDGHFFGSTINIAARIATVAKAGEVLCSETFSKQIKNNDAFVFIDYGNFEFKNISTKIHVFAIAPAVSSEASSLRDPVCHMLIGIPYPELTYVYRDTTFHFCSSHCLSIFKNSHPTQ